MYTIYSGTRQTMHFIQGGWADVHMAIPVSPRLGPVSRLRNPPGARGGRGPQIRSGPGSAECVPPASSRPYLE